MLEFNSWMGIEGYIFSLLQCAKSSLTMWNNLQRACQSNQLHTPSVHFRTHSQCTSKIHMKEDTHSHWVTRRSDRPTALPSQWPLCHRDRQAKRKPVPVWLKLLIRHSLSVHSSTCSPTCHFSWGLNSDKVKVADLSMGGQRFCWLNLPFLSVIPLYHVPLPSVGKNLYLGKYLMVLWP